MKGAAAEGDAAEDPAAADDWDEAGLQPHDAFLDGWTEFFLGRADGADSLNESSSASASSSERWDRRLVPPPEASDLSVGAASSRILSRNDPRIFVEVARNSHVASLE